MLLWLLFFFIAFGSKVVLATAMIYLMLEEERGCPSCDEETMLMRMGPLGSLQSWLTFGRVQKRWCPRCRWEGLTRSGRMNPVSKLASPASEPPALPRRRRG